jgi:hypothetical protein
MTVTAHRIAVFSTGVYALGQAADLATTYWLSPVLDQESNLIVERFGWGWPGMLTFALVATVVMFLVQGWMWRRLLRLLPCRQMGYQSLYRRLLLGDSQPQEGYAFTSYLPGVLMGIAFVVAYAAIVSKLLAAGWNLALGAQWVEYAHPRFVLTVKNSLAASVGILSFFALPPVLNSRGFRDG